MLFSRSVRDTAVSFSSAETELRELNEFGYQQPLLIIDYEDNLVVLTNPRTRHLNKIRNFIIQEINSLTFQVVKVPGTDNVADVFTKPHDKELFTKHRSTLLGSNLVI